MVMFKFYWSPHCHPPDITSPQLGQIGAGGVGSGATGVGWWLWPGFGSHCSGFEATQPSPGPLTCPGVGWSAGGPLLPWPISESPASQAHEGQPGGSQGPGLQPQCPPPYTPTLPCVPAATSGFQHLQSEKVELKSGLDPSPAPVPGHKPVRTWEDVPEKPR